MRSSERKIRAFQAVVEMLLSWDISLLETVDDYDWQPIHVAANFAKEKVNAFYTEDIKAGI